MYLKFGDKELYFYIFLKIFYKSFDQIQISDQVKNKQNPYLENSIGPKRLFLTSEQRTGSSLSLIWELRPSRISSTLSGVSSPSASHQVLHSRIADPYLKYRVKRNTKKNHVFVTYLPPFLAGTNSHLPSVLLDSLRL